MEIYKQIKGFENYEVSNLGNVRNVKSGCMKTQIDTNGYKIVKLRKDKQTFTLRLHRIIAEHFIPNPDNKPYVDHADNDRTNNTIENLRWCTSQENNTSGYKGVSFSNKEQKWRARIQLNGKRIHIGYFDNIEDAKSARQEKANQLFGIFTNHIETFVIF